MVHRLPITQARINLGQIVRRVHVDKELFVLEKDGIPVAAIINVDEFQSFLKQINPRAYEELLASNNSHQLDSLEPGRRQSSKRKKK